MARRYCPESYYGLTPYDRGTSWRKKARRHPALAWVVTSGRKLTTNAAGQTRRLEKRKQNLTLERPDGRLEKDGGRGYSGLRLLGCNGV